MQTGAGSTWHVFVGFSCPRPPGQHMFSCHVRNSHSSNYECWKSDPLFLPLVPKREASWRPCAHPQLCTFQKTAAPSPYSMQLHSSCNKSKKTLFLLQWRQSFFCCIWRVFRSWPLAASVLRPFMVYFIKFLFGQGVKRGFHALSQRFISHFSETFCV